MARKDIEVQDSRMDTDRPSRREFLEKAGRFAAYTPPVLLSLLVPGEYAIASGGHKKDKKDKKDKKHNKRQSKWQNKWQNKW